MAILSPVLIGGMGLGAETGYWYYTQRKLQHAADVAAHAAGVRKRVGDNQMGLNDAALRTAAASGFTPAYKDAATVTNITVNNPPSSGALVGKSSAVEVNLFETKPRLLSSIFLKDPVQIAARAVAQVVGGSPACVLALSETKPKAVEVSGSTSVTLQGCSVVSNSVQADAYYMPNSTAYLSADCVSTVGEASVKNASPDLLDLKTCSSVQENAPKALDPYADVAEPDYSSIPCETTSTLTGDVYPHYTDARYGKVSRFCSKVTLKNVVTFHEGLYIIDETELVMNGGEIHGHDVTFFFSKNATAKLAGNPLIDLSAPTTDSSIPELRQFSGLLFFGARCALDPTTCGEVFSITGASGSQIQGAIYLPGSAVDFLGNSTSSSSCLQIIADKVTFTGNSTITMGSTCSSAGTKTVLVGQVVKLVE